MAAGITLTTDLDGIIQIIYMAARETADFSTPMRQAVADFDIISKPGRTLHLPKFGLLTAESVDEGEDYVNPQKMGSTKTVATAGKAKTQVIITDEDIDDSNEDMFKRFGRIAGMALAKKDDQDALALFSAVDTGLSHAHTAFTIGYFSAAHTQLKNVPVPSVMADDIRCVLHPSHVHDMATELLLDSSFGNNMALAPAGSAWAQKFAARELFGVTIIEDGNIERDGSDDAYGCMFHKDAFGRVTKKNLWIEKERNASQDAWELNAGMRYLYFEADALYSRYLLFDAADPTS